MDINKAIHRAYREGVAERKANPSTYDEQVENYFIFEAFEEGARDRRLFGSLYDANLNLADEAKWGKFYRDRETSFLMRTN
jgi:hypothetical protein